MSRLPPILPSASGPYPYSSPKLSSAGPLGTSSPSGSPRPFLAHHLPGTLSPYRDSSTRFSHLGSPRISALSRDATSSLHHNHYPTSSSRPTSPAPAHSSDGSRSPSPSGSHHSSASRKRLRTGQDAGGSTEEYGRRQRTATGDGAASNEEPTIHGSPRSYPSLDTKSESRSILTLILTRTPPFCSSLRSRRDRVESFSLSLFPTVWLWFWLAWLDLARRFHFD